MNFNKTARPYMWSKLERGVDVLVIGGGITGASILRDAILRGMSAALIDGQDFAAGTSSRSSQLVHGGLRYVQMLDFRVVWESCHERNLQVKLNPHLITPEPFLIPIYRNSGQSRFSLRIGMIAYEALSGFHNKNKYRFVSGGAVVKLVPGINQEGLSGGCIYWDASVTDSRWTIELIKDSVRRGGLALNHATLSSFIKEGDRIKGALVKDTFSGATHIIRARCVVNATGVSADRVRQLDDPATKPIVTLSRGTHLIFSLSKIPLKSTIAFSSPVDGRLLFLIKRPDCVLYGTTDQGSSGNPLKPGPTKDDVEYLLRSLHGLMPSVTVTKKDILYCYSGFRPLLRSGKDVGTSSRRDHLEISTSGLITMVGGKLTTSRAMAERVVDAVELDGNWKSCTTNTTPLPRRKEGIKYSCENEMPCTIEDLIERRVATLGWDVQKRLAVAQKSKKIICRALGLSEREWRKELSEYKESLRRFHSC